MLPFGTLANNVSRCKLSNNPTKNRAKHLTSAAKPRVLSRLESKLDAKLSCFPLQLGMEATLSWWLRSLQRPGTLPNWKPVEKNILRLKLHSPRVMVCNTSSSFPVRSILYLSWSCNNATRRLCMGWKVQMPPETLCHPSSKKISQAKKELNNHTIHWQCC
jgi:hypothetical protein